MSIEESITLENASMMLVNTLSLKYRELKSASEREQNQLLKIELERQAAAAYEQLQRASMVADRY